MSLIGSFFGGSKDDKGKRGSGRRQGDDSAKKRKPGSRSGSKSRRSVRRKAKQPSTMTKKPKQPSSVVLPKGSEDKSKPEPPARPHKIRTSPKNKRLGQLLIKADVLDEDTLDDVLDEQQESGGLLGRLLIKKGLANIKDVGAALKKQRTITTVLMPNVEFDPEVLALLDKDFCVKSRLIPFERIGNQLCLAMSNVLDTNAKNDVKEKTKLSVKAFDADWREVQEAIEKHMVESTQSEQAEEKAVPDAASEELEIELPDEELIETMAPLPTASTGSPLLDTETIEDEETIDSVGPGKDRETEFIERPQPEQVAPIGGDVEDVEELPVDIEEVAEVEEAGESVAAEDDFLDIDLGDIEEPEAVTEVPEVAEEPATVADEAVMEIEDIEEIEEIEESAGITEIEEPVAAEIDEISEVAEEPVMEIEDITDVEEIEEVGESAGIAEAEDTVDVGVGDIDLVDIEGIEEIEEVEAASEIPEGVEAQATVEEEPTLEIAEIEEQESITEIEAVTEEPAEVAAVGESEQVAELDEVEAITEIEISDEEAPLPESGEEIIEITDEIEEYAEADTMAAPPIPGKPEVEEIHDIEGIEVIEEITAPISLSPLPSGRLDGIPITADYFAEIVQWDQADPERRWLAEHLADNVLPVAAAPDLVVSS